MKRHIKLYEDLNPQEKQYTVQIIKCDSPLCWYKDYINKTFQVVEDKTKGGWNDGKERWKIVKSDLPGVNYIRKDDCKIIQ